MDVATKTTGQRNEGRFESVLNSAAHKERVARLDAMEAKAGNTKHYYATITRTVEQTVEVEARDEQEAKRLIAEGNCRCVVQANVSSDFLEFGEQTAA